MMTKLSSVDDLLKALEETKFRYVGIPKDWTFGNNVKIDSENQNYLNIKGKLFRVVVDLGEFNIIAIPGN